MKLFNNTFENPFIIIKGFPLLTIYLIVIFFIIKVDFCIVEMILIVSYWPKQSSENEKFVKLTYSHEVKVCILLQGYYPSYLHS
jgi:hypothetical protein